MINKKIRLGKLKCLVELFYASSFSIYLLSYKWLMMMTKCVLKGIYSVFFFFVYYYYDYVLWIKANWAINHYIKYYKVTKIFIIQDTCQFYETIAFVLYSACTLNKILVFRINWIINLFLTGRNIWSSNS